MLGQYDKSAGNKTLTRACSRFSFLEFFPPLSLFLFFNLSSPARSNPTTAPTTTFYSLVPLLILSFSLSMFQFSLFFSRLKLGFMYEPESHCVNQTGDLTTNNKLSSPSSKCVFEFSRLCASLSAFPLFFFLCIFLYFFFFFHCLRRKYHGK